MTEHKVVKFPDQSELDKQFLTLEAQRQIIRNQAKEISERVRLAASK